MLDILEIVKEAHLRDIEISNKWGCKIEGLCLIAKQNLSSEQYIVFIDLLKSSTGSDLGLFIWDRDNKNTGRLEWLNEQIAKQLLINK